MLCFVPLLLSSAAIAITFKALLDPNFGLGAGLGSSLLTQDWLGEANLAMGVVIFVISWQFIPFHTLIYQGAARQIPRAMYEAAEIDGAGRLRQFFSITLPQLKYTIITSSTLMVVGSLTFFDLIFVLTAGGPGDATRVLALDMYKRGLPGRPDGTRQRDRGHPRAGRARAGAAPAPARRRLGDRQPDGRRLTWQHVPWAACDRATPTSCRLNWLGGAAGWLWLLVVVPPLYWIVITSFKTQSNYFVTNPLALPGEPTLDNYRLRHRVGLHPLLR